MVNTTKEQQVIEKLNKYVSFYSSSSSSSSSYGPDNCSVAVEVVLCDRLVDDLIDEPFL